MITWLVRMVAEIVAVAAADLPAALAAPTAVTRVAAAAPVLGAAPGATLEDAPAAAVQAAAVAPTARRLPQLRRRSTLHW